MHVFHSMTPRRITCLATLTLLCIGPMNAEVAAQTTQDEKLPDAEALLQKMVKAMGGEKTIRKHTHQKLTGTFEMPAMGISAELVSYGAKPNLAVTHIEIVGMGGVHQGYDGKVAWRDDFQTGPMILQDKQAEQAAQRSDYYADLNYLKNFKSVEVTGRTEFGGQDCYELKLIRSEDDEQGLYINAETYLIAGRVSMSATPQGDVEVITTFEEYKEYDGQQIPVRTHVDFGGFQEQVVTIEEVSFEPYDEEVFALPDSIKALMKDDEAPASQPSD